MIIFLSISLNMCFGCSKEQSHWDGSFEYPQHMFWLRNKNIIFSYTPLSGGLIVCQQFALNNIFFYTTLGGISPNFTRMIFGPFLFHNYSTITLVAMATETKKSWIRASFPMHRMFTKIFLSKNTGPKWKYVAQSDSLGNQLPNSYMH